MEWSCLRSSFEDSGDTTRAAARWIRWRRAVCLSEMPYRIEFSWSRVQTRRNKCGCDRDRPSCAVVCSVPNRIAADLIIKPYMQANPGPSPSLRQCRYTYTINCSHLQPICMCSYFIFFIYRILMLLNVNDINWAPSLRNFGRD